MAFPFRQFLLFIVASIAFSPCFAVEKKAVVIPSAYVQIANENRVPPELLFVVSLGESGTKLQSGRVLPWPWTLNIAGKAKYFRTRKEAYSALLEAIQQDKLVDVSLGQVNWQSHYKSFNNDPWAALEPFQNLRIAARLLRSHFDADNSDWWYAVGKYHSPGKKPEQIARAQKYSDAAKARYVRLFGSEVKLVLASN